MRRTRFVTLTTDIGWAYAAQMKAVLARRAPNASVVDIAHDVAPQAIPEAAFLLGHVAPQFPPGTVHVAVVDPGVGGVRAPVAVRTQDGSFLVGPDNGVLSLACQTLGGGRTVRLTRPRQSSATFEGRDVFAPAAAALATGTTIGRLGVAHVLRELRLPRARRSPGGLSGEVVYVDVFGNAVTNLAGDALPPRTTTVTLRPGSGRARSADVWRTYEDGAEGAIGILPSSFGWLEVAARNGSAARRLALRRGSPVTVRWGLRAGEAVN
jgi:S-adenosylmethionine hydrolase